MTTLAIHELLTAAQLDTARQALGKLPKNDISTATQRQYVDEVNRLLTTSDSVDELWNQLIDIPKKRSYYFSRAALKYGIRLHLQGMLYESTHAEESPDKAQADLAFLLGILHKFDEHAGRCPLKNPKPRKSKRQALTALSDDWRLALYQRSLQNGGQYALPLAVATVTGCRPHELQTGIELQVRDGVLTCKILGAKVKKDQGQPERQICYEIGSNPFVDALVDAVSVEGVKLVQIKSEKAFSEAVKRSSRTLWPRKKEAVTPYCLRHAAASDFKACMSEEDVSAALGHYSADTKSLYGQRQMSRSTGAMRPISVQATRPVKTAKGRSIAQSMSILTTVVVGLVVFDFKTSVRQRVLPFLALKPVCRCRF